MLFFHTFKASGSTFSVYTNDYRGHLKKQWSLYDILEKSILEGNIYIKDL